jgi:hypothetical protein
MLNEWKLVGIRGEKTGRIEKEIRKKGKETNGHKLQGN